MKASVCHEGGAPEVLRYEDVPDATVSPEGVLIEVKAAGIQGGEVTARARPLPFSPLVLGGQAAGVIREVGAHVAGWTVGQRVVAMTTIGSNAELVSADAAKVWSIPDEMSFESAAAVPVEFGTAHDALFEFGQLQAGQTVLIQAAASGVGVAAVQLAKAAGAVVIGTASSDERLERLQEFGLDHSINYVNSDVAQTVRDLTNGRGADLVIDPIGGASIAISLDSIAYRGRVTLVGDAGRDDIWPNPVQLAIKNAVMCGMYLSSELEVNRERVWPIIDGLLERVASSELTAVVDSTFSLSDASAAHRHIESRKAFGRVVLVP